MTEPRQLPPVNEPFRPLAVETTEHDLSGVIAGQQHDQGSSSGRHFVQDPLNETAIAPADADADEFNPDDYDYVRIGGKVRAIPKASVQDEPETATQNIPATQMVAVKDPHFYVHLADGNVIRVKESDLPAAAGTNAAFGHWQIDAKVFQIIGVYPLEDIVKGEKE
jgi:hypothetical protein